MNCSFFKDRLIEYIDNELSKEAVNRLENHLKSCKACSEELILHMDLLKEIKSYKLPDPGKRFWKAFPRKTLQRLKGKTEKEPGFFNRLYDLFPLQRVGYAAAAALIVILLAGMLAKNIYKKNGLDIASTQDELMAAIDMPYDTAILPSTEITQDELRELTYRLLMNNSNGSLLIAKEEVSFMYEAPYQEIAQMEKEDLERLSNLL